MIQKFLPEHLIPHVLKLFDLVDRDEIGLRSPILLLESPKLLEQLRGDAILLQIGEMRSFEHCQAIFRRVIVDKLDC